MASALLMACSSDDILPENPKEGPVQLASLGVGSMTRGTIIDDNFAFNSRDKVIMTATVNSAKVSNTFTYTGAKWIQDAPEGNYSLICIQDNPEIESVVSYGGISTAPADDGRNQSSMERYIAADVLKADEFMGKIGFAGGAVSARLDHASADFVVKVRDGRGAANILDEDTPVLTVTVDRDGLSPGSTTYDYISWNTGKSQDENGDWYTTFRVILPDGCTILKATLSKVNATAGDATTGMYFYRGTDGETSKKIELKSGVRYTATYNYKEYMSVGSVNLLIEGFVTLPETDIVVGMKSSAGPGWVPQTRVPLTE